MSLQRPILSPVTTAGMLYETKTKSKMCSKCGKEIIYTDKYSLVRHINFEHNPMKNPDVVKKLNPANYKKYDNNKDFDDIYWILLDFASSRAISRTVPTGISDSHA